jgi:hypothetical protein
MQKKKHGIQNDDGAARFASPFVMRASLRRAAARLLLDRLPADLHRGWAGAVRGWLACHPGKQQTGFVHYIHALSSEVYLTQTRILFV